MTRMGTALLWERVGALADAAPGTSDLRHHKLQLIAAARLRARGETLPPALVQEERLAAVVSLALPAVLRRARMACDGRLVLMKGAEVAARWPRPELRPARDVDLLVDDADAIQAALLAAGFVELDDPSRYGEMHHCPPLMLPGLPLLVEIHRRPHWCGGSPAPVADILDAAQPSILGIDGILAPRLDHHAVILAAHAWAHDPLDRIGPLADIAVMAEAAGAEASARVAEGWGLAASWRATMRTIEELLGDDQASRAPVWKRHLPAARERTVFEGHVSRIVAPVAATSAPRAPLALLTALLSALRRAPGEKWGTKFSRSARALRHAAWRRSRHEAAIGPAAGGAD